MPTTQTAVFTANGNWPCPAGVSAVMVTMVGGGGGSPAVNTLDDEGSVGGAGAGEIVINYLMPVVPENVYPVVVGAGGVGGVTQPAQPTIATSSSFNGVSALNSRLYLGLPQGGNNSGAGGGAGGSPGFINGAGYVAKGARESSNWTGGGGGGGGTIYSDPAGVNGGVISIGGAVLGVSSGGAGAGAIWGGTQGALTGTPASAPASPTHYGAGAGGTWDSGNGVATIGGNGAPGYVMLMWVA